MLKKRKAIWIISVLALIMTSGIIEGAEKETWPVKPISIFIAYSAGGTADIIARGLAREMQDYLKTAINCVNLTGAAGSAAGRQVATAPSDGYSWFAANAHTSSGWRTLGFTDLSWTDFYGFHVATSPYIFFVSAKSKWQKFEDIIQYMRENPGKLKWGTAALGGMNHVTGTVMLNSLGAIANHIPYSGGREAGIKLMGGEIDFSWAGVSDVADLVKSGDVRVLGIIDAQDYEVAGKVKYVAPSLLKKYPNLSVVQDLLYWGMHIKRDTPDPIVKKIKEAFTYAIKQPRFIQLCQSRDVIIKPYTGVEDDQLCARLESIYAWGLFDEGLSAKGVTPAQFQIPKVKDYKWPPYEKAAKIKAWPK